jgi:carbamoyl-phosphate synthase large subunit
MNRPVVLVTSVGAPPGLNALRALVEADVCDLIAADADPRSPGLYQFPTQHAVLPWATDTQVYLGALKDLIRTQNVAVILPCLEDEVVVLALHRAELEAMGAKLLLPDAEVVNIATDKGTCVHIARNNGIECPASQVLPANSPASERRALLQQFAASCPPPWIVKPVWGHGMRGVQQVTSLDEATAVSCTTSSELLVQEFIPGPVGSMHLAGLLYDGEGRLVRRFSSRSIRTLYESGGPATAGVSIDCPGMVETTERLVALIGIWRGPLNAEWMLDPRDGKLKFIEINPRMWGYGYLATGSGINFPQAIVSLALGRDIGPDPGFRVGVTLLRSTTDLIFTNNPFEPKE